MAIGAKHVLVVALVTALLTYGVFQGKSSSHGDGASLAGRKGLSDAQPQDAAPVLAEESLAETVLDTSQDATVEEEISEEATEKTSEATSEETLEDFKEDVREFMSEEASPDEVSAEPVVEVVEPSADESTAVEGSWRSEGNGEASEFSEAAAEGEQVREMEEVLSPQGMPSPVTAAAEEPSTAVKNPDSSNFPKPRGNPNVYLQSIAQDNAAGRKNERYIQACIKQDGCGTP